jgi:hypothetical protein
MDHAGRARTNAERFDQMSRLGLSMTMSLDDNGFVAGPNQVRASRSASGGHSCTKWLSALKAFP